MSATFILDCSLTMSWCFPDEATEASTKILDRLEDETGLVPTHWFLEVANVLAMAEKKKRITLAKLTEFIAQIGVMDFEVDNESASRAFNHILALCRDYGLTAYDAAYLDLALRRRLPLASLDDELRAAAKKAGVQVIGK